MKKLNFAIYSRKSKFTGKGESIENQIEMCKTYLAVKFPNDYSEERLCVYEDEGFSGANIKRPEFLRMLEDARASKFGTIICYRLDRVSRNISDFAKLIDELDELDVSFISIKEQFDTTMPMGRAMMYISSIFSQLERETIGERIKDNMEELAKDGRWLGGITPSGYRSVRVSDGAKHKQVLEIVPHEAEVVKTVFEEFVKARSLSECAKVLARNNMHSKNSKPFTPVTIRGILSNPVYMKADVDAYHFLCTQGVHIYADKDDFDGNFGVMAYRKTLQKAGRANQRLELTKWIVAIGQHEGIVGAKLWIQAYKILKIPAMRNDYALLSGIIMCSVCKTAMNVKKRADKRGFYYVCGSRCGVKGLSGEWADEVVREKLEIRNEELETERSMAREAVGRIYWDGRRLLGEGDFAKTMR